MSADLGHAADVLTVTYGDSGAVLPLLASLERQAAHVHRVMIWHNGPGSFDRSILPVGSLQVEVHEDGQNLGYGAGINRLWQLVKAPVAVIVNPDVELEANCIHHLVMAAQKPPAPVLVGGLLRDADGKVNAFALSLTWDGVGINLDRGKDFASFGELTNSMGLAAEATALAPSGALFAVNRERWEQLGGGALFAESLFLYLEDLALGLRVRKRGGGLRFCTEARGLHRFSDSTGRRSALKLFHVERNRLWLLRVIVGQKGALALMPFTCLRLAAYVKAQKPGAVAAQNGPLAATLLRAWRVGLFAPLPAELCTYLAGGDAVPLHRFVAPLRNQLQDPTA